MDGKTVGRLGELPPRAAELLGDALALTAELDARGRASGDWATEAGVYAAALDAVGFPKHTPPPSFSERAIGRAEALDGPQRVMAEILAHVVGPDLQRFAMPASAWVRRQWLGIDPPGPLFAVQVGGEPVYFAVRAAAARSDHEAEKLLGELPPATRLAVLADLKLAALDYWKVHVGNLLAEAIDAIGAEAAQWARAFADRLLSIFASDVPVTERGNARGISVELRRAAFVPLVRAGIAIEPRWDDLLSLGRWIPAAEMKASIAAIAPPRRAAALAGALERIAFPNEAVHVGLALLPDHPDEAIARLVLTKLDQVAKPKEVLAQMAKLAKHAPGVAAALAAQTADNADIPTFRVTESLASVTLDALDDEARAQLERANERYGGRKVEVERLFDDEELDEQIVPRLTRRLRLSDPRGTHRFDVWEYMGDSGTIFEAGATKVVAEIIQGGLECDDRKLKLALSEALASARAERTKGGKKPVAKKPVAKKPVAKKPVAKKPVAKKPVAKKPVAKKRVAKKPVAKKPVAKKARAKAGKR